MLTWFKKTHIICYQTLLYFYFWFSREYCSTTNTFKYNCLCLYKIQVHIHITTTYFFTYFSFICLYIIHLYMLWKNIKNIYTLKYKCLPHTLLRLKFWRHATFTIHFYRLSTPFYYHEVSHHGSENKKHLDLGIFSTFSIQIFTNVTYWMKNQIWMIRLHERMISSTKVVHIIHPCKT